MGEFVGKRVVPDHVGIWDQNKTYEPLMIVLDNATGDSYISRRAVPSGISLADESYWSLCAHYSAQMRKLEQDVSLDVQQMHSDVNAAKNAMSKELSDTKTAMSRELTDTHTAMSQELSQTEQRVENNLKQTSTELTGRVEQAKSDLNTGRQELQDAKAALTKRMDSIAGSRTSNAEVLDARVDAEGKTHTSLGAHIRSGFERVWNDQQESVNHLCRMAAVSDAMRTANLVHTVDTEAQNTSGEVKAKAVSYGHGDRAGAILNGQLKEGENGVSVLRFTEPMSIKAGTPYTVFIDETTPKMGYGVFFYEVDTGVCLQVNGVNRGFTPANNVISTAVFDNGGMFRAGVYSTDCEFENHEIHLYVVEGEYTRKDFFGMPAAEDISKNAAEIASVRDEVRKDNLIIMRQVMVNDEAGEPLFTATPVGTLNLGATVLNGKLGPTAGTYITQISATFQLEQEKNYTLLVLDDRKDIEYSVFLLDVDAWKDVMENGKTREFNVIHSPCGLIPAHRTGPHQLRLWVKTDTVFKDREVQVYLVEGEHEENELRAYLPAKEAATAMSGISENIVSAGRVSDTLRRNNLIRTVSRKAVDSSNAVRATAESMGVPSGTIISGSLGPNVGVSTLHFGEDFWLDSSKTYTLYARAGEDMPECSVYFYGNSKSGCMQVSGVNKGFSVHAIAPQTFTPDESCYYRPGVYTSQNLEFENCELHLFVLEGAYTYADVRGLVEFNDLNDSITAMSAVRDFIRKENLLRTTNYSDGNAQTQAKIQMIADNESDQSMIRMEGNMGGALALNSIRCTSLFHMVKGKTYTLFVIAEKDCPMFTAYAGDEVTYGSVQIDGVTVAVNSKNNPVHTFTADKDYDCRLRIACDTATSFTGQRAHFYLVEGSYTGQQMRSWAGYDELVALESATSEMTQALAQKEEARWDSVQNGLENVMTVSDRARMYNMVKAIDSSVKNNEGKVSATATACGILDSAGVVINGTMSSEMNASILKFSEPMHLEKGKTYTAHIVDPDPTAPYSMFFYKVGSNACLQQDGTNRGVSAIGGRFELVIPDATGDYQMGIYSTGAQFDNHLIHAYLYEGTDWSADDFYAYPTSTLLASCISEMAAVKDSVRKKNLVRMLSGKGFRDGAGVYRLNAIGMPDPAGLVLNGEVGTATTVSYTNISEVFHLEAGQTYTILIRDDDKTMDYNVTIVDKTTGNSIRQDGAGLAFHVQKSPFANFVPDASQDVRLRINFRKAMTCEDHILHVYLVEGKYSLTDMLAFAQEKEEEPEEDTGFPYESYNLPILKLTGSMKDISKSNKVNLTYTYGELSGSCTLKWQGASSIAYDKKNFTITFGAAQTIVESWGAQKKYCLKANYVDFSHCRNIVAAKLWGQALRTRSKRNEKLYPLPNGGAIDGFPIMLVINDEYQGIYTFNIPKDKWMFGMTDGARECILTAETHAKGTQFAEEAKVDATDFEMEYVPDEANTQWVKDSVNTLIRTVMNFSGTTAAEVDSVIGPYLDIDSAVDYFIITCMFALTDNLDKNYILLTFDGVKWMFSEYDLDTAFGNRWDGKTYYNPSTIVTLKSFANTHKMMGILYNCDKDKIKARYAALRKNVLSEGNVQTTVSNFLVDIPKGLLDEEVVLWPKIPGTNTNNMSQILNWYRLRCIEMDAEINAL